MKTLLAVTLVACAIAVPVALGDTPPPPSIQTAPSGQNQTAPSDRVQRIEQRIQRISQRFEQRCGTSSAGAPQQCVTFAQNAEQRLGKIDTRLQALIAKWQQAGKDVAPLTTLDTAVQTLAQSVKAWLGS